MISIIIPVYNVATYLAACLDSILKQSYADWELILVDDGSTDASGEICDTYEAKDARIHCLHQSNAGVSQARNAGIAHAKGAWLTFIDGDDWIGDEYLTHLVEPILENPQLDLVHGGCLNHQEGVGVNVNQQYERYSGSDPLYILTHFRGLAVAKLFKKSIIDQQGIQFDTQVSIGEDYLFTLDYLLQVKQYCLIEHTEYYYRQHTASATQSNQKISYEAGLHQAVHNLASLKRYLAANSLANDEAAKRWEDIANNLFFLIRSNGWRHIAHNTRSQIRSILRQEPLLRFQTVMKRKIYLWAFSLYCKIQMD